MFDDAGEVTCRQCGDPLDGPCAHARCCAPAVSTRGHFAVVSSVSDGMMLADPSTRLEVRGLTDSAERPADILTRGAIPGSEAALDVTIAAQDAQHAGMDACVSAYRRKMARYRHLLPALRRAGVIFRSMAWSAAGRPHPETTRMLRTAVPLVRSAKGAEAATQL